MSPPWMPLYVADYLADTGELSTIEHGAYLLLIMAYWQKGGLPNEDAKLARIARLTNLQWSKIRPTIAAFFSDEWRHKRIDDELAHAADVISKRKAAVAEREKKKRSNDPSNDDQDIDHTPIPSPSPKKDKDAADAAPSGKFTFESGVIRLTSKDFAKWKEAFSHLDLAAELIALAPWAAEQPKWFHAVSGALAKRNREMKLRAESVRNGTGLPLTPSGNAWPEGII